MIRLSLHILLFTLFYTLSFAATNPSTIKFEAITQPSADLVLAYQRFGLIDKVLVKEGDIVSQGQQLAQLHSEVEKEKLKQLQAEQKNHTKFEQAKAIFEQAQRDVKHLGDAGGAVGQREIEHAKLEMIKAKLDMQQAQFELKQIQMKIDEVQLQLKQSVLNCPIKGRVEKIHKQEGETAEPGKEAFRIVSISPLHVAVPIPQAQAALLKVGNLAIVHFGKISEPGKIIFKSAVADAASGMLLLRVETPNKTARSAGERVFVSFTGLK